MRLPSRRVDEDGEGSALKHCGSGSGSGNGSGSGSGSGSAVFPIDSEHPTLAPRVQGPARARQASRPREEATAAAGRRTGPEGHPADVRAVAQRWILRAVPFVPLDRFAVCTYSISP